MSVCLVDVLWGQDTALQDGTFDFSPEAAAAVTHGSVTHYRGRHSVIWREKKSRYRQGIKPEKKAESWRLIQCQHWKIGQWHYLGWLFGHVWTLLMCSRLYFSHHCFYVKICIICILRHRVSQSLTQHFYSSTHKYNKRQCSRSENDWRGVEFPGLSSPHFFAIYFSLLFVCSFIGCLFVCWGCSVMLSLSAASCSVTSAVQRVWTSCIYRSACLRTEPAARE